MKAVWPLRVLLGALIIVPALAFAFNAWRSYDGHFDFAEDRLERMANALHEHAIKVFETNELVANYVGEMLADLSNEEIRAREAAFHTQLDAVRASLSQIQDIWILDRDGFPLVTANIYPAPREVDLSDREYYRVHRDERVSGPYISGILEGRVRKTVFFQISNPLPSTDGEFRGVIAISILPSYFSDFYAGIANDDNFTASVIRGDGAILARYPVPTVSTAELARSSKFMNTVAEKPLSGMYRAISAVDGVERLFVYRKLPHQNVYVAAGLSVAEIRKGWMAENISYLVFGLPATLGLIFLTFLAIRQTRQEARAHALLREEVQRREATEEQLRQATKMEAVGRLTGGIAHDFNNLLTAIGGNLDLLRRRLPPDEKLRLPAERAKQSVERAAKLTHHLLAFARQQPLKPQRLDLNRLVRDMSDLLRQTLGETIRIDLQLADGLWPTLADANQLEHTLLNLALNARDAMPEGGRLTIRTANCASDHDYSEIPDCDPLVEGEFVQLVVEDSGVGMAPEVAAKAFEPFFTTKPQGQGTGLGLSQVYGFVKQSNGYVTIGSDKGQGACVTIYLPRHQAAPQALADSPGVTELDAPPGNGRERILLVEDDPAVRSYAAEVLRDFGYRVVEAGHGRAALAALDNQTSPFDLLLTDVVLPGGMNGRQISEEVCRRQPGIRVLYTTGYSRTALSRDGQLYEDVELLPKPFTSDALAGKVRRMLDARK